MGDKSIRSRQCMFVLYPESQQREIEYVQQNFPCAWALHDKDVHLKDAKDGSYCKGDLKKPHVHFVCKFANARYFSGIAKEIGVSENTIGRCNNLYKAYVYLWHKLTPEKFQYEETIVGVHEFEVPSETAGMSALEDEQVKLLLEMPRFNSVGEMASWAYEQGVWMSFKKQYVLWRDMMRERQQEKENLTWGESYLNPEAQDFLQHPTVEYVDKNGYKVMRDSVEHPFKEG